jgi:acyl dehydratase
MEKAKMAEGTFTPELIAEMKSKIGLKLRVEDALFNEEATRTAIRKFADGIGDPNPLWRNQDYARKTRYGGIVAPPSWVLSVLSAIQFGWRGIAGFHSGSEFFFYKPVRAGDKITPEETFKGFDGPKPSAFADLMVVDYFENLYFNQRRETVSKMVLWVIRTERKRAREKGKYQSITLPHPWKEEELEKIEREVLREEIRGANPRYWEDVQIGEDLSPLVKGPLGFTDMVAFFVGGGSPVKLEAHSVALKQYREKPNWAFRDPQTSALEPIFAVHYNRSASQAMGLPYPYDVGTQRQCWQIQFLTHWMGDDGWLKRCRAEYRKFVFLSDVLWFKGKVEKKYIDEDGEPCVDVSTSVSNQRGEEVMPGDATVVLPSREKKIWPLEKRL